MIFIDELYQKTVADNEVNLKFWENYLDSLKSLNFDAYSKKLKVPILVPIGNKILFRGELKHTNEVTVALGADYFVKCSTAQAEVLRQHRIKGAQSHVDQYKKEKEYLEKQIQVSKDNIYEKEGQELLEVYSEEEDKAWREKHKENVRKHKQKTAKEETKIENALTDEELMERLEELELQEDMESEMLDNFNEIVDKRKENNFLLSDECLLLNTFKEEVKLNLSEKSNSKQESNITKDMKVKNEVESIDNEVNLIVTEKASIEAPKIDLLQQVLHKQNELENKLHELKYREREQSKTEQDLIARLDEMEQLDELEDEMERLDDLLQTEDIESDYSSQSEPDSSNTKSIKLKKSITFASDDNTKTIEITFTHSETEVNNNPYDSEKGISKPSDLYEAYSNLFNNKTVSILKKSKYGSDDLDQVTPKTKPTKQVKIVENLETCQSFEADECSIDRTIVIKDVVEKVSVNQHNIEGGARPTSLFKKRRMQNKS